jgi:hypothetical protein
MYSPFHDVITEFDFVIDKLHELCALIDCKKTCQFYLLCKPEGGLIYAETCSCDYVLTIKSCSVYYQLCT